MTIAQPVSLQSLDDEFNLPGKKTVTPLRAGIICVKGKEKELMSTAQQKTFRSEVVKLMHTTRW